MALSNIEKTQILRRLGVPVGAIRMGSQYYSDYIDQKLKAPELTDEAETEAKGLLTRVVALDTQLADAPNRLKAASIGGEIQLNMDEIGQLRAERRRVLRELGDLLEISLDDYKQPWHLT